MTVYVNFLFVQYAILLVTDSEALRAARGLSEDRKSFTENVLKKCIPKFQQHELKPARGLLFTYNRVREVQPVSKEQSAKENARNKLKALRLSRKLEDKTYAKSLLKICHELPKHDIEKIKQEDVTQCLPSEFKAFVLKETPMPPADYIWV